MMYEFGGHGWGMLWWWVIGIALFILVIVLIVKAMGSPRGNHPESEKTAIDILKERYAKGELTKQEYEERKQDILS